MRTIVYIMGVPCSGKTTILKQWTRKGGATVPEFFEGVPDYVHNSGKESFNVKREAQSWVLEQHRLKELCMQNFALDGVILVERSPLDLVAYGRALDELYMSKEVVTPEASIARWTEKQVTSMSWTPGIFILLEASIDVIGKRWIVQRKITWEQWENYWKPFTEVLQKEYRNVLMGAYTGKRNRNIVTIRTDESIEASLAQIEEHFQDQMRDVVSFLAT